MKRRDDIEKSARILYEKVMYWRNPILVLVLLTEISGGDAKDLYYHTACKLEKSMFCKFGEKYSTLMLDKDLEGRDLLQIIQKNKYYKLIQSQTVETVIRL